MEAVGAQPPEDVVELRVALADARAEAARVQAISADLEARNALLELQNEKMRRALYGQRSERSRQLIDQMERECQEFRVWPGMKGRKEFPHATTQRACDP